MLEILNTVADLAEEAQAVIDDYDVDGWLQFYEDNPNFLRSVGAEGNDDEEGDGGEGSDEEGSDEEGDGGEGSDEEGSDWRDGISDGDERKFADQFTTPGEAVTFAFKSRQQLSNAVSMPGKDAEPEAVTEFWGKLGMPKEADGYELKMPEGHDEPSEGDITFQGTMRDLFHAAHLTTAQAEVLNQGYNEMTLQVLEQQGKTEDDARQGSEDALKELWGNDYDANLIHSKRTVAAFGDADYRKFLDETIVGGDQLGSHPLMNKIHATIGRRLGEGTINLAMTDSEKSDGEQRRGELTTEIHAATDAGDTAKANRLMKEREELTVNLHGTEAI